MFMSCAGTDSPDTSRCGIPGCSSIATTAAEASIAPRASPSKRLAITRRAEISASRSSAPIAAPSHSRAAWSLGSASTHAAARSLAAARS
jgi:hypothetical protein